MVAPAKNITETSGFAVTTFVTSITASTPSSAPARPAPLKSSTPVRRDSTVTRWPALAPDRGDMRARHACAAGDGESHGILLRVSTGCRVSTLAPGSSHAQRIRTGEGG